MHSGFYENAVILISSVFNLRQDKVYIAFFYSLHTTGGKERRERKERKERKEGKKGKKGGKERKERRERKERKEVG